MRAHHVSSTRRPRLYISLFVMADLITLTATADFAARKHRDQRRKDKEASPYINHPIGVAHNATAIGGITDIVTLQACLLHDTVEDTNTTYEELVDAFGKEVADVVMEVTDDKTQPKAARKRAQVAHVPHISDRAKLVKLCDKLHNLRDLVTNPPKGYTLERIQGYCIWAKMDLAGARGLNAALERVLDEEIFNGTFMFEGSKNLCCPDHLDEVHIFPSQ